MKKLTLMLIAISILTACSSNLSKVNTESDYDHRSSSTFHGYDCTDDCSGHEAGYEWAEKNDISDFDNCSGRSQSFIEGCEAYVEENYSNLFDGDYDYGRVGGGY